VSRLRQHNSNVADLENVENVFLNVNTPADLDLAVELWKKGHRAST